MVYSFVKRFLPIASLIISFSGFSQTALWHNKERRVLYQPEGEDIVITNGQRRFNRAIYGTHSAFRVEAGDLPEFAMYMPGMGGNLSFGIMSEDKQKWLINMNHIKAIYRAGSMIYEIGDEMLGKGKLTITVLALSSSDGMIVKIKAEDIPDNVQLIWVYGGASGKKFSRDGDIGADPESSFYLKNSNCVDNRYQLSEGKFLLNYGSGKTLTEEEQRRIAANPNDSLPGDIPKTRSITGYYPESSTVKLIDAADLAQAFNPTMKGKKDFCVSGRFNLLNREDNFFMLHNTATPVAKSAMEEFASAEAARKTLASRIIINTPDKYLNTLGAAMSIAADAIWEDPTYLHGAIAWRMRLNGWRGPYAADPLGWHDRARKHFEAYAKSQLTEPATLPLEMDTAFNFARHVEKVGTPLFSEGYITRHPDGYVGAHHYDMNLGFVDQLLNHFQYTGDLDFIKKMWPLLRRHLAWEKRNFDADGDGLYDAYAAIWASDALQYSGGGVTHASAYNYRANNDAARLAGLIGEDGSQYEEEADKILSAMNQLWMPEKGWYAEYKDLLGNKLLHPSAGIWTIYHSIDSKVPNAFMSYQLLRYIDNYIPHIPVIAKGWNENNLSIVSETNWQPYTWSLNNVAIGENLHTALAYWQGNRSEEAFRLWRSMLLETMYLGSGPGNFHQLSFYDALRGELYRDFADGLGMLARTTVEGLFGIQPDVLKDTLAIKVGLPEAWDYASLITPDIKFDFKRKGLKDHYSITQQYEKLMNVSFVVKAYRNNIEEILVNNKPVKWSVVSNAVGDPLLHINLPKSKSFAVDIIWRGNDFEPEREEIQLHQGDAFSWSTSAEIVSIFDPQHLLSNTARSKNKLKSIVNCQPGHKTLFVQGKEGLFTYWKPVNLHVRERTPKLNAAMTVESKLEMINLSSSFNDSVGSIFRNKYLSPRPAAATLQLPVTGIGNWAYHSVKVDITDKGLRSLAGTKNQITTSNNIPFETPGSAEAKNIVFTSMWDNYPDSAVIDLSGKSSHAYFLMAGSTNPMQSRMINGEIIVNYSDGTSAKLELKNPENWWPIEQDYYIDGFAFTTDAPKPIRIALKCGKEIPADYKYTSIKGLTNFAIEGGAATVLDLPLDSNKQLRNLVLKSVANDVVIGLMALTLAR